MRYLRHAVVGFVALAAMMFVAVAAGAGGVKAKPYVYDPDGTGIIVSAWQTKMGLPDAGKSDHGLVLQKNGPTATNAAAVVEIAGVEGLAADGIYGFDYKAGTYCGAGAPRFNLLASDGFHFLGGCANATHSPAGMDRFGNPWTHASIDATNPAQAFPPVTPGATIVWLYMVFDEEGQTVVDNIAVDTFVMGKPGA